MVRTMAQDPGDFDVRPGAHPVQLLPTTQRAGRNYGADGVNLGDWNYRASKAPPRDGVPWELTVAPARGREDDWTRGIGGLPPALRSVEKRAPDVVIGPPLPPKHVIVIPDVLWKRWMAADLQDVVGIHFHEVVSTDVARILFTLHKIPPDSPPGPRPPPEHAGPTGTRIEATLLTPFTLHLDQAIVVREDPLNKDLATARAAHEEGHADISRQVFFAVLAGPQDWQPRYCTGRRSRVEYYWKQERIGRSWPGYQDGEGKLLTTRTTVALVPPTRWSLMLPIPPERVTQTHLQAFNDSIVHVSQMFAELDQRAQERFHAEHGSFEAAGP